LTLVLGVGNDLRGDDAAGPAVARALEWQLERAGNRTWRVDVVQGLTPELVDDLAAVARVIFVDAAADPELQAPRWLVHEPGIRERGPLLGHALDAAGLLSWCRELHGRVPQAATLALPARSFELGAPLTPVAAAGAAWALAELQRLALAG
jgi:hydrogenase maturation protease